MRKLTYIEVQMLFNKNDEIISLKDGKTYKYSGSLTIAGDGYDSFNKDLVLYRDGELATIVKKGVDEEHEKYMEHIKNVSETCKRLNCTTTELLHKNYMKELGYD